MQLNKILKILNLMPEETIFDTWLNKRNYFIIFKKDLKNLMQFYSEVFNKQFKIHSIYNNKQILEKLILIIDDNKIDILIAKGIKNNKHKIVYYNKKYLYKIIKELMRVLTKNNNEMKALNILFREVLTRENFTKFNVYSLLNYFPEMERLYNINILQFVDTFKRNKMFIKEYSEIYNPNTKKYEWKVIISEKFTGNYLDKYLAGLYQFYDCYYYTIKSNSLILPVKSTQVLIIKLTKPMQLFIKNELVKKKLNA